MDPNLQNQLEPQPAEEQQPVQPQAQPPPAAQPSPAAQPPPAQGQTVDIEAMKREAQKNRQASQLKPVPSQEYKVFTKKYILAVTILLIISIVVFGLIVYFQMQRG